MSLGISTLEMHLRQELPPLYGRDHTAYRSAYFPVKVGMYLLNQLFPLMFQIQYGKCSLPTLFDSVVGADTYWCETFGPEHRPRVEFALDNIQTMKLQQQGFKRNKEDFHKNDNTNNGIPTINNRENARPQEMHYQWQGIAKKLKTSMSEVPKMEIN
ncbi:hypothetical protein FXO38_32474 [Capsicum annuum]|nr:hypothetical protein FXO38_32474 [Capsicum annuum]